MPEPHITSTGYLLYGFELICKPKLRRFVIIPFLINLLLFAGLLALSLHEWGRLNDWIVGLLPHWLHWLTWILWVFFIGSSILIVVYTFTFIANLIGAPFNSLLAEKVEAYLTGELPPETSLWAITKDIPRVLRREVQKLLYYLPRAVGLLILFFIPLIQIVAAPLWFIFSAWMITLQYIDYPADNHRIPWRLCRQQARQKGVASLSFGSVTLLASMIPIINFLVMPAAVAGATAFWVEHLKK